MDKIIRDSRIKLQVKGILCLDDLEYNFSSKEEDFEISKYFTWNEEYNIEKIGKKGSEKTYIINKKNNVQVINTVNMMLSGLKSIKNDFLSNQISSYKNFEIDISKYESQLSDFLLVNQDQTNRSRSSGWHKNKIEVNNFDEFKNEFDKFLNNNLKEFEFNNLFLRGNSRIEYNTVASIFRNENYYKSEDTMHHELTTKKPFEFQNVNSHLEILQIMQHYGLPTRLLDATTNLLVALYFACSSNERKDGEVLIYSPKTENVKKANSDTIEILCAIAGLRMNEKEEIHKLIIANEKGNIDVDYFNSTLIVKKLIHEIRKVTGDFECSINPKDLQKTYFVVPTRKNERIIRQDGVFLVNGLHVFNDNVNYNNIVESNVHELSKFQVKKNGVKLHFIIPSNSKQQILSELNLLGINQSSLFPEIDNVANFIRTKYYK